MWERTAEIYAIIFRWGWPEDVWFHVDKVSSAHVYARLPSGQTIDDMPEALVEDCAQLVKANSIQVFIYLNAEDAMLSQLCSLNRKILSGKYFKF